MRFLKNNINLGHVLISLSIMTFTLSMIIMLSQTNFYIDSLTAESFENPLMYIPKSIFFILAISFVFMCLIFVKNKED